jgi:S1-C subfamily serine protease
MRKDESMNSPRPQRGRAVVATAIVASALAGAGVGVGTYAALDRGGTTTVEQTAAAPSAQPASNANLSVGEIYERASKGVVEITVTSAGSTDAVPFGGGSQRSQGSGFVYDTEGHVVTNEHVVDGADTISVQFPGGASYRATVVGMDPSTDLALIKVDAPSDILHALPLGDSTTTKVGDGVVAIGSPFGLEESVTAGIVSALHREITSPNQFAIEDAIQTDAAINHGNSGGPLLNLRGQVIGVNAQIQSDGGGSDGVGFAVPSATVRTIIGQILTSGKVEHAYLGVGIQTIPKSIARELNEAAGAALTDVRPNTPADRASLKPATSQRTVEGVQYATGGDVVTAIDGAPVSTDDGLRRAIDEHKPGDTVTLTVVRGGKERTVKVELVARPAS